jgi:hypothetical protein
VSMSTILKPFLIVDSSLSLRAFATDPPKRYRQPQWYPMLIRTTTAAVVRLAVALNVGLALVNSRMCRRLCTMSMPVSSDFLPPSSLISCSQSEPSDACLTSAASCGFTQVGGDMCSLPRRMERIVEAIGF